MEINKNKRGQFFAIYIVFITLFLCGAVFLIRYQQIGVGENELVSPKEVLDIVDGLEVFEMREVELIEKSFEGINFGEDGFENKFREKFLAEIESSDKMKDFIFYRLVLDDREVGRTPNFFANFLYPDKLTSVRDGKLYFGREGAGKKIVFKPSDKSSNYFPVTFTFGFEKSYVVSSVGGKIKVEDL